MNKRIGKRLLSILVMTLMIVGMMPAWSFVYADAVSHQNVEVDATASGEINGPWTLTFTAKQTRAPEDGEVNFGTNAEMRVSLGRVLDVSNATVAVSPSDSGATATLENKQLVVTGYDYGAHLNAPLTVTITNVAVHDANLDNDESITAGEVANADAISGIRWFAANDGMHSVNFPIPTVQVVKLTQPEKMSWTGKTVSWTAVDGADGYNVTYMGGSAGKQEIKTTDTSIDLTDYIDQEDMYTVHVEPTRGAHVADIFASTAKRFYRLTLKPLYKDSYSADAYQAGTTGGTISGVAESGATFTAIPTTAGDYSAGGLEAFVPDGDSVTITATPADGYTGTLYVGPDPSASDPLSYSFTVNSTQYHDFTGRFDVIPPEPVTVILEVGEGHEGLAKKISDAAAAAGYEPTLSGTTLTMAKFPVLDEHGETVTVQDGADDVIYELVRTAFGPGSGYWRDNGEQLIDTALKTIENYDSEEAIYEELDAATDAIANNQKYYLLWAEPVSKVALTIEKPICGTKVKQNPDEDVFENRPVVTASDDSDVVIGRFAKYWVDTGGMAPITEMDIKGGEDYTALEELQPKFGFFIDQNNLPKVTVTNAKSTGLGNLLRGVITITVTADHDWDEGEVTKEPTTTAEGEMTYKCKHFDTCGGTKTEKIPKLELITVTLIPSTMDGSEIGDPIVLTIPKGESLDSYTATDGRYKALVEQLKNMNEGYYPYSGNVYVTDKPYSEYSSEDDVDDADEELFDKALTENTTFYVPMDKFIEELDVTVERPMAGTQVDVATHYGSVQDGAKGLPTTTISDDKVATHYELPYWVTDDITMVDYDKPFNGTIRAREDYKVLIQLVAKLGWAFKILDDPAYVTINGKAVDKVLFSAHYYHDILGTVPSDFSYNLYVGGVHVTDSNKDDVLGDGTVKFDPENVKLTLNNANIEISRREDSDDFHEYGIRSNLGDGMAEFRDKPLTIELIGANTISDGTNDEGTTEKYGIFVASSGTVTYTGGGTLNVNMKDANTAQRYLGLQHHQAINVDGVDINIDIDGTSNGINGIYMRYTNTLKLMNGANVTIDVAKGYAFDNNVQGNKDLSVAEGCMLVAITGGNNGALHGNNWVLPTDESKELGVLVNTEPTATGRTEWDGTASFEKYKYVRIPGVQSVTVNYDLGEGHEELAQADALKEAINKRHAMEVIGVEGSVVKIKVPELSDNNTKNTVARLLGALQVALNESVGHDPLYGPYWVYDQKQWNFNNALKTLENYSSIDEVGDEHEAAYKNGTMPEDGQTIYALWAEPISEVAIDVEAPLCGTEVTADLRDPENPDMGYDEETQTPQPVVSTSTEHVSIYEEDGWEYTWWVDQTRKEEAGFTILPPCYIGTMEGDQDYMMVVTVEPDFGYYLPEDVKFIASNGTVDEKLSHSIDSFADTYITLTAEHEEGEPIEENRVEPTCTKEGSYDEVVYCKHHDTCGKEFSRETKTLDALGHDWGEWTVTKPATEDEEGVETRTCARCDETETRAIPKLDPQPEPTPTPPKHSYSNIEGDGNTWTKGSTETSDFVFERSIDDDETYGRFIKALVDGKEISEKDYTKAPGSLKISLKPEYLETLAVGEHTLTAVFDDGEVSAKFKILAKDDKKEDVTPDKKSDTNNKTTPAKKQSAATGDDTNILIWVLIIAVAAVGVLATALKRKDE